MVLSGNVSYIPNQPSLADELFDTVSNSFREFLKKRNFEKQLKEVQIHILEMTKKAHNYNAKMEDIRDFVDMYAINDVEEDEKILNQFSEFIDDVLPDIEDILDSREVSRLPEPVKNTLINAYDELYSTMVNVNFSISQKIAQGYIATQSNTELLQEA